jgi:hypothetical protein
MKHVAVVSVILVICVYVVISTDPPFKASSGISDVTSQMSGGDRTTQKTNPLVRLSTSVETISELGPKLTNSSNTGLGSSKAPLDINAKDVIVIGSYLNPDDSPPFDQEEKESISIGVFVDADSKEDMPQNPYEQTISIGVQLEPDSSSYDQLAEPTEIIALGQPIDVNTFLAGEDTLSDRPHILVGEQIEVPL